MPRPVSVGAFCAALLVLMGVSGCVGGSGSPAGETSSTDSSDPTARASSAVGAIVGTVIDDAKLPIAGALVGLSPSSERQTSLAHATTNEAGGFSFADVPAGAYIVQVGALGYASKATKVDVAADEETRLTIILADIAAIEPYVEIITRSDLISCRAAAIFFSSTGQCTNAGSAGQTFNITEGQLLVVSETVWTQSQEYLHQQFISGPLLKNAWSRPVHRVELWPGSRDTNTTVSALGQPGPVPTGSYRLLVYTLYAGQLADEINQYARPACVLYNTRCSGVGAVVELRHTQHVSVFVNGLPPDAQAYSALPKP